MCKICGKPTKYNTISTGYSTYCSNKCINADPEVRKKITLSTKVTLLEKFGVENISQIPEIKAKKEKNNVTQVWGN